MRVLITGGRGYIGYITGRMLAEAGHTVRLLDDLSNAVAESAPLVTRMFHTTCSIESLEAAEVLKSFFPDVILHCAALTAVEQGELNPLAYMKTNVEAFGQFLRNVRAGQPIVFSSSCAVYGHPPLAPLDDDHLARPESVYGWTKLIGERMLAWDARVRKHRVAILRYFNVVGTAYGLRPDPMDARVIPLLARAAIKGEPFTINGTDYPTRDGTCVRDYVHVLDIARAHVAAVEKISKPGFGVKTINLGTGHGTSVLELVSLVQEVFGLPIRTARGPRRDGDMAFAVAAARRAETLLGWAPKYSLKDALLSVKESLELESA